jgi:hypothetical protein
MKTLTAFYLFCTAASAVAQSKDHITSITIPIVDGIVEDIVAGDHYTAIRGTTLSAIGPYWGNGVVLDAATGAPDSEFPRFHTNINAVISDGQGGWFVAGIFIDEYYVEALAHIKSDKTIDRAWQLFIPEGVNALALDGNTLYLGGTFTNGLAACSATTGELLPWAPIVDGEVKTLAVANGVVYVGGSFTSVDGEPRQNIAAIDGTTGVLTTWDPAIEGTNAAVHDVVVAGNTAYVAGSFSMAAGSARNSLAALDATTGSALAWDAGLDASAIVNTLVLSETTLFIGGNFTTVGGQGRKHLAAVQADAGTVTAWNPVVDDPEVRDLALSGTTLYVAGNFTTVNTVEKKGLVAIHTATGANVSWNVDPQVPVSRIALSGTNVFAASSERLRIGWLPCDNFAVINNSTGEATLTDLDLDGGEIIEMNMVYDVLYLSGTFTKINGTDREHLGALDLNTGSVLPWAPVTNGTVHAFAGEGTRMFLGGGFTSVNGTDRSGLAAVNMTTGALLPWACDLDNGEVLALDILNNSLYLGGSFASIRSSERHGTAAVSMDDGEVLAWHAEENMAGVSQIDAATDVVSVKDINLSIVGIHGETGEIQFYIPEDIRGFIRVGTTLVLGGPINFGSTGYFGLASFDVFKGFRQWYADVRNDAQGDPSIFAVARNGENYFIGGGFQKMAFENRTGFGAYPIEHTGCTALGDITFAEGTLTAPAGEHYQWLVNGNPAEETLQTFHPDLTKSGSYAVIVEREDCPNTWRYFDYEYEPPVTEPPVTEPPVTAVELDLLSSIQVYPNPARDVLRVVIPEKQSLQTLTLHNLLGQVMRIKQYDDQSIALTDLPTGPYVLMVKTSAGDKSFKVMKIP